MADQEDEKANRLGSSYGAAVPGLLASLRSISQVASVMAIVVGCLVLVGWVLNIETLKRFLPGLTATNPSAAIAFVLAGVSLWLLGVKRIDQKRRWLRIAQGCALLVALIGLLKLTGVVIGWDLGIDQLLFRQKLDAKYQLPNRMAPNTALNLLLIGSSLLLLDRRTRRCRWPSQFLALAAAMASSLPLIGYAYDIESFYYGPISYIPMPLPTALTVIVLVIGILCARPDRGLMAIAISDGAGGVMARRLLPAAILIPAVLGWLRLEGEQAGLYDTELGVTLLVLANIVIFTILVGWNARLLYQIDTKRKQAEEEIRQLNETLEEQVAKRTAQLADREGQLKELIGKLMAAQEEERRRIACEVHDGLTQIATATHQHLQTFVDDHPPGSKVRPRELDRALELAQRAVKEARRVIEGLRPTALDDFGLVTALRLMVEELNEEGWEIGYEEDLGDERLPPQVETALYRVTQEALTNVKKHAQTNKAHVTLARLPGKVRLEVRDEGRGFDPSAGSDDGETGEKVGLSGMRERVALLGGRLKIRSKPEAGTCLVAEVPLPARECKESNDHTDQ